MEANNTPNVEATAERFMATLRSFVAEWKAMLPSDNPKAAEVIARIDAAMAKMEALPAARKTSILANIDREVRTSAKYRVERAGVYLKQAEGAK